MLSTHFDQASLQNKLLIKNYITNFALLRQDIHKGQAQLCFFGFMFVQCLLISVQDANTARKHKACSRLSQTLEISDRTHAAIKVGQLSGRVNKTEHLPMQSLKFCPQYFVILHCVLSELILQPKYKPAPLQSLDNFLLHCCIPN